jgi:hypothetical protein
MRLRDYALCGCECFRLCTQEKESYGTDNWELDEIFQNSSVEDDYIHRLSIIILRD